MSKRGCLIVHTFFSSWLARATPERNAVGSPFANAGRLYMSIRSSLLARDTICATRSKKENAKKLRRLLEALLNTTDVLGGFGSFRRSILPLLRRRISRARYSSSTESPTRPSPSSSSSSPLEMNERPGVSMKRIVWSSNSKVTSCGSSVVVGPRDDEARVYTGSAARLSNEFISELLPTCKK